MMNGDKFAPGRMLRAFMVKDGATSRAFRLRCRQFRTSGIVTVSHGDPITEPDITARLKGAAA
jgi:hypothetical protein